MLVIVRYTKALTAHSYLLHYILHSLLVVSGPPALRDMLQPTIQDNRDRSVREDDNAVGVIYAVYDETSFCGIFGKLFVQVDNSGRFLMRRSSSGQRDRYQISRVFYT